MKRRSFLKSLAALGASPLIPSLPGLASVTPAAASLPAGTLQWAETIARAHKSCSLAMLQRHLRLDAGTASLVKNQLIEKGIISANANAYGLHSAAKPLWDGAHIMPTNPTGSAGQWLEKSSRAPTGSDSPVTPERADLSPVDEGEQDLDLESAFDDAVQPQPETDPAVSATGVDDIPAADEIEAQEGESHGAEIHEDPMDRPVADEADTRSV